MNNNIPHEGEEKKNVVKPISKALPKGALERIKDLEGQNQVLTQSFYELINQSNQRFNQNAEVLNALVELTGKDAVQAKLEELRKQRDADRVAAAEAQIKSQLEAGTLEPTDVITDVSTIVGVEYDKEGTPVPPGRIQVPFLSVLPQLQEKLLGKGPGERVETAVGTLFEVLEIYNAVVPPPAPVIDVADEETSPEVPVVVPPPPVTEEPTTATAEA